MISVFQRIVKTERKNKENGRKGQKGQNTFEIGSDVTTQRAFLFLELMVVITCR